MNMSPSRTENADVTQNMMEGNKAYQKHMQSGPEDPMMMMLVTISNTLTTIQTDIRSLKEGKITTEEQIAGMQFDIEDDQEEITQQRTELNKCQDKVDILTNTMVRYEQKLNALTDKCNYLEAKALRAELVIFGLKDSKDSCITIVKTFLKDKMEIHNPLSIATAYWKGKGNNRPMIVRLSNAHDKGAIFVKVSKLKGKKNHKDQPYRISDNLPEAISEEQRCYRQILAANKSLQDSEQIDMKLQKGQLLINGQRYQKKIAPPCIRELLDLSEDTLHSIKEMQVAESKETREDGSTFKSYAKHVKTIKEVCECLQHMRKKHSDATHISCAYHLTGLNKAYDEDYLNDEEHSMGRRMLEKITKMQLMDICVFIVCHYSGKHLGYRRYEIAMELIDEAMSWINKGVLTLSKLPLHCLLQHTHRSTRKTCHGKGTFPAIRGAHKNHPSFKSTVYNRFSLLQLPTDEETEQAYDSLDSVADDWDTMKTADMDTDWAQQTEKVFAFPAPANPGDKISVAEQLESSASNL